MFYGAELAGKISGCQAQQDMGRQIAEHGHMPQFRLSHEDAVAVVAYLRSLKK